MEDRLSIRREDGNSHADAEILTRVSLAEQRLDQHDDLHEISRVTREEFIPRIITMEKAVLTLETEVPKLSTAVTALTHELTAQRATRRTVSWIVGWGFGIVATVSGAVLSWKAIDVLQARASVVKVN